MLTSIPIPALLKMTAVFFLILFAIRRRLSLGNAFMIGAIVMGFMFGMSVYEVIQSIPASILEPKTLAMAGIVSMIMVLSRAMESAGSMQRLLSHFRGLISRPRIKLIVFPALIGLLPMPGGAVFSAPMVKDIGGHYSFSNAKLSFINYWFRHIWEYWWPMYPGVLLATLMADINLALFVAVMFPLTIVALYIGWVPLKFRYSELISESTETKAWIPFLRELLPIIIAIGPGLGLGMLFHAQWPDLVIMKEAGLICALLAAILWIYFREQINSPSMRQILMDPQLLKMIYMVLAIFIFKGILEDSHAVDKISREFLQLKIPLGLITVILPFLVGLFTGITVAFVGSTFPILISLFHSLPGTGELMPYIMLGLTAGFMGVLLSPLHLCLLLSNEYFTAPQASVYRLLLVPCLGLLITASGYFILLTFIWERL